MANLKDLADAQLVQSKAKDADKAKKENDAAVKASNDAQAAKFAALLKAKGPRAIIDAGNLSVTVFTASADGKSVTSQVIPVADNVELPVDGPQPVVNPAAADVATEPAKLPPAKPESTKVLPSGVPVRHPEPAAKPEVKPAVKPEANPYPGKDEPSKPFSTYPKADPIKPESFKPQPIKPEPAKPSVQNPKPPYRKDW